MTENKCKQGDTVKIKSNLKQGDGYSCYCAAKMVLYAGKTMTIAEKGSDKSWYLNEDNGYWEWTEDMFDLSTIKKSKEKPEDLTRYMVYGMGCDNKSKLFMEETELKTEMKSRTTDSNWSGRIIGYKLIPLYESKKEVRLLSLVRKTKITKVKSKRWKRKYVKSGKYKKKKSR